MKISFLTICGLNPKLSYQEFLEFVYTCDVLGIAETKMLSTDLNVNEKNKDTAGIPQSNTKGIKEQKKQQ
jgi:hypothetical protein